MSRRIGQNHRVNPDRYFHVMGEGWYAQTREGVAGPYPAKQQAIEFIEVVITGSRPLDMSPLQI